MNLKDMNEQEKREHFEKINRNFSSKKKSICMFCNCKCQSIGSHSISKSYYLKKISDNNTVGAFVSKRMKDSKELVWERIGISKKASVFPGYCKEHDDIFNNIDVNGIISAKDLLLQCYRSICYWLRMTEKASGVLGQIQNDVDDTLSAKIQQSNLKIDYSKIRFGDDYQKNKYDDVLSLQTLKELFENLIKNDADTCLNKKISSSVNIDINIDSGIEIMYLRVEEKIPIVINSMNTVLQGNVFHIVLPNDNSTDIIVINATHKKLKFKEAWETRTQNMLNILSLIESWMIAEETWYINPSIIEKLPDERLEIIKDDIRYSQCERKLWEPYDVSIFDDLRKKYLDIYKQQNIITFEREIEENIRFKIPKRNPRNQREKHMQEVIIERQMYNLYRKK